MDVARSLLVALLDLIETDPDLQERARRVLGVDAAPSAPAYLGRAEARAMGVEVRALLRAERSGGIVAFKVGRRVVCRLADVRQLVEAHAVVPSRAAPTVARTPEEPADAWERALVPGGETPRARGMRGAGPGSRSGAALDTR